MTDLLREWVLGVAVTALMAMCAMAITPQSRVRGIVRMCCAAAMCASLIMPLSSADFSGYARGMAMLREAAAASGEIGGQSAERLSRTIIESECAAYISDKGEGLGLTVGEVRVLAKWGDEFWYPYEVWIDAPRSDELMMSIEGELGVPRERICWSDDETET